MSLGSSLSGISFGGISSGIDTDAIVSRLIELQRQPVQRLQRRQTELQARQALLAQVRTQAGAVAQAMNALNVSNAFNPTKGTSSNTTAASIATSNGSVAGSYSLSISRIAQAQKLSSSAQWDISAALNQTGKIVVNGKAISIEASDTLQIVASKINGASAGVTASVLNGGPGNAFLVLNAAASGASNRMQLGDLDGTVLQSLGIVSGSLGMREAITNGGRTLGFSSATQALGSFLGNATDTGTIQVNGQDVAIDLAIDSLQSIADKINQLGGDATATVSTTTVNGSTRYRLDLSGTTSPTLVDASGILEGIGMLQRSAGNQLVAPQDAAYSIDGIALTSSTNTITGVLPGSTLTLLRGNETTPETSTITVERDDSQIRTALGRVRDAYNSMVEFIRNNSRLDPETLATGPLFGDPIVRQLEDTIGSALFQNVAGTAGPYRNLVSIGFGLDSGGKLEFDETVFNQAQAADPEAVRRLFQAAGSSTVGTLSFVSSSPRAVPVSGAGYAVSIDQVATRATYTGFLAQSTASTDAETLTFSGSLFGPSNVTLRLDIGSTAADVVQKVNSDSRLRNVVTAALVDGKIQFTSGRFGTSGGFAVFSDRQAATNNSGVGIAGEGIAVAGLDVAGTINGEAATGNGQFLTGNSGNGTTEGLQLQYTGTATGTIGAITFSRGMSSTLNDLLNTFTRSRDGLLSASDSSIQDQIDGISDTINELNIRLERQQADLRNRFTRMEEAIARLQTQSIRFNALNAQQTR